MYCGGDVDVLGAPGYLFSLRFVMDTCALVNACRWLGGGRSLGVTVVDS